MRTTPDEIVLPITAPETEWIAGRAVQKMSPTGDHSVVQGFLTAYLRTWAGDRGIVGPEWRFRIAPVGEPRRPLVPDIAYLSFDRASGLTRDELQAPVVAPDLVVEILSPGDRRADVREKCRVYRSASVRVVLVVDPATRTVERFDADGTHATVDATNAALREFPGLAIPFGDALFGELDRGFGDDGRIRALP